MLQKKYEKKFFFLQPRVRFFVDTWSDGNKQFFSLGPRPAKLS